MKIPMRRLRPGQAVMALAVMLATAAFAPPARSAPPAPLAGDARPVIEQFLRARSAGLPGKVSITLHTPLAGPLPPCAAVEPFLPAGARLWGRVSVGVRCAESLPWTRYVQAYVAVVGNYYVATRQLEAGETLTPADTALREGDLTALPASIIADPGQLSGVLVLNRIALGAPMRQEFLRAASVVQQGQNVKVVTQGPGFVISTEGRAMSQAAAGALVQVKTQNGQMISGVVRADGVVERAN